MQPTQFLYAVPICKDDRLSIHTDGDIKEHFHKHLRDLKWNRILLMIVQLLLPKMCLGLWSLFIPT